jgi:hypothetical protein
MWRRMRSWFSSLQINWQTALWYVCRGFSSGNRLLTTKSKRCSSTISDRYKVAGWYWFRIEVSPMPLIACLERVSS